MEVLGLVEPLELQVHRLRLAHVRPNRQVLLIFFRYEVFELLLDLDLSQPLLQPVGLIPDEPGQVVRDLLVGVEAEHVLGLVEALPQLLQQLLPARNTNRPDSQFDQGLDDERREEVGVGEEVLPELFLRFGREGHHEVLQFEGYLLLEVLQEKELELLAEVLQEISLIVGHKALLLLVGQQHSDVLVLVVLYEQVIPELLEPVEH